MLDWLKGKRTIFTGVFMILLGISNGETQLILEGAGLIFLRVGIK